MVTKKHKSEEEGVRATRIHPAPRHRRDVSPVHKGQKQSFRKSRASPARSGRYALVAAKDGGPAAFVDRREATKLPDTHLKTWESKSKS